MRGTKFAQNLNSNSSKVSGIPNDKKMKVILNNFCKQLTNQRRDIEPAKSTDQAKSQHPK